MEGNHYGGTNLPVNNTKVAVTAQYSRHGRCIDYLLILLHLLETIAFRDEGEREAGTVSADETRLKSDNDIDINYFCDKSTGETIIGELVRENERNEINLDNFSNIATFNMKTRNKTTSTICSYGLINE